MPDKKMLHLEGYVRAHVALFYFPQAVTLPAHAADVLGCTLHGFFLFVLSGETRC